MSLPDWHTRYMQQARWTESLRSYLYSKAEAGNSSHILEVGCGTGAVLQGYSRESGSQPQFLCGLDIDGHNLQQARGYAQGAALVCGDGYQLPFASISFDAVICHYLLLWTPEPAHILAEMKRVTKPGGVVLALAEPDYGGRVDYPGELSKLGEWQAQALQRQGAEPEMGRKLRTAFIQAGIEIQESGVLGGQWGKAQPSEDLDSEWTVLRSDLEGFSGYDEKEVERLHEIEQQSVQRGEHVLFVPTFYCWGRI